MRKETTTVKTVWHKFSEEKPQEQKNYLVCRYLIDPYMYVYNICYWSVYENKFYRSTYNGCSEYDGVLAWAEIPEYKKIWLY